MMTIRVDNKGPLAGLLSNQNQVNLTDHPNRSKYWNGSPPPPDLIRPHGKLIVVQIAKDADGRTTDANIVIPEQAAQAWSTPVYVVTHVGPDVKWVKPGDLVGVPTKIEFMVVRVDGWEVLLCHEEQTMFALPTKRLTVYDEQG